MSNEATAAQLRAQLAEQHAAGDTAAALATRRQLDALTRPARETAVRPPEETR